MSQVPVITYEEAVAEFERPAELARALGVSRASVSEWKTKGVLPEGRVWQLIALRPSRFGHLQATASAGPAPAAEGGDPDTSEVELEVQERRVA